MYHEINHPLLKHKITILRDKKTDHKEFRELTSAITMLIAYEALKNVELADYEIETPLCKTTGKALKNDIIIIPILRAGIGMLDGILKLVPDAHVGFIGIYRDHDTTRPVLYYEKIPVTQRSPIAFIIDPMLATGGSLVEAIRILKEKKINQINIISIISTLEGIQNVKTAYPDVDIYTGNIDEKLNDNKYIIPGLGDAGDRLFGTK
jgi:uracil phosphoribosyltransferase